MPPQKYRQNRARANVEAAKDIVQQLSHHESSGFNVVDTENYHPFTDYAQPTAEELNLLNGERLAVLSMTQQTTLSESKKHPIYDIDNHHFYTADASARHILKNSGISVVSPADFCHAELMNNLDGDFEA
jgi:hypothetical protein